MAFLLRTHQRVEKHEKLQKCPTNSPGFLTQFTLHTITPIAISV